MREPLRHGPACTRGRFQVEAPCEVTRYPESFSHAVTARLAVRGVVVSRGTGHRLRLAALERASAQSAVMRGNNSKRECSAKSTHRRNHERASPAANTAYAVVGQFLP